MKKVRGAFGSTSDRIVSPDSTGSSVSLIGSSERRDDNSLSYDDWVKKQKDSGWPEWFVRWMFPRENYDGSNEFQGFTNFGSFIGSVFGLGTANTWLPALIGSIGNSSESVQSGSKTGSGLASWLKNLFSGSNVGSGNGLFSGLSDTLLGFGSQYASSLLNYQNMEKLIDKQNAYNTPAAQMQRFADAGLNPNLVYGLGSNGNQPSSGSIAPVDFDTSQREARLARMQIDTQTKLANADVAQKMSAVNLNNANTRLASENANNIGLQNQTYFADWCNTQAIKIAQYKEIVNRIDNDNKRVAMEKDLNDAEIYLKKIQSESRSQVGAVGSDIIILMSKFTEFMNDVTEDMPQPSDFGIRSDSYSAPNNPDSNYHPVVPPGYNGR